MGHPRRSASTPLLQDKTPYTPEARYSFASMLSRIFRRAPPPIEPVALVALQKATIRSALKNLHIPEPLLPGQDLSRESVWLRLVCFLESGFAEDARGWEEPRLSTRETQWHLSNDWTEQVKDARREGPKEMKVVMHTMLNELERVVPHLFGELYAGREYQVMSTARFLARQVERVRRANRSALRRIHRKMIERARPGEGEMLDALWEVEYVFELREDATEDEEEGWRRLLRQLAWKGMLKALSAQLDFEWKDLFK